MATTVAELRQGGAVQKKETPKTLPQMLEAYKSQIAAALPKHINPDRMVRIALTAYRLQPKLQECDLASVFGSIVQASQLGLEPGLNGSCYLVPFYNNKKRRMECQHIPGYRGLLSLARRSGDVTSVNAEIVYEHDKYKLTLGIDPKVEHEPLVIGDRGKPIFGYAAARLKDGSYCFTWMTIDQINGIKERSKSRDKSGKLTGPWITDEEEMQRKTLIRRLSKYLPMSVELANAITAADAADAGKSITIDGDFVTLSEDDVDEGSESEKKVEPAAVTQNSGEQLPPMDPRQKEPVQAGTASAAASTMTME